MQPRGALALHAVHSSQLRYISEQRCHRLAKRVQLALPFFPPSQGQLYARGHVFVAPAPSHGHPVPHTSDRVSVIL
jgi:hypothetical protein